MYFLYIVGLPLRKILKPGVIPSVSLPSVVSGKPSTSARSKRTARRTNKIERENILAEILDENEVQINKEACIGEAIEITETNSVDNDKEWKEKYYALKTDYYSKFKRTSQRKIQNLQKQISYYKNKKNSKLSNQDVKNKMLEILSHCFTSQQINIILNKKKRVVWDSENIAMAFTLRYYSKKVYISRP